jgi:hypothetical protein
MAITLLDITIAKVGVKDTYTMEDTDEAGVPFFAGCQDCGASLAAHNAYPSKTGYIKCRGCIGDLGFNSVDEFH